MSALNAEAVILNIQKFSTEDGPGIRTTVFFKGCPMRCPWCHNPESIRLQPEVVWQQGRCLCDLRCLAICPVSALKAEAGAVTIDRGRCTGCGACADFCPALALKLHGSRMRVREVVELVARDRVFYQESGGGVTLSGGEPLAQPAACIALLQRLREAGIHTALDTCGAVSGQVLRDALQSTELVLFDVKTADPVRHLEFTGVSLDQVASAARMVAESGVEVWVRTPVVPGYTDGEQNIRAVARFVAATFPNCTRHDLLAFSNLCTNKYAQLGRPFALAGVPLLQEAAMDRLCSLAREEGSFHARWSGPTRVESED